MKMTIEKAKGILDGYKRLGTPMDNPAFQKELKLAVYRIKEATGFIEGWNQAIEKIEREIVSSQNYLSVDRESVLMFVRNLKVKGEK